MYSKVTYCISQWKFCNTNYSYFLVKDSQNSDQQLTQNRKSLKINLLDAFSDSKWSTVVFGQGVVVTKFEGSMLANSDVELQKTEKVALNHVDGCSRIARLSPENPPKFFVQQLHYY